MQLYVQPGTYYVGATRILFLGGSSPTFTAPSANPRIDLVTADSSGTIAIVGGTESASPVAPSYPANKLVLAEIYHVVGETALYDNDNQQASEGYVLNDVRPALAPPYISGLPQVASGLFVPDPGSDAQGDILYYGGAAFSRLPAGTSGFFLKTQGAGANPAWAQPSTQVANVTSPVNLTTGTTETTMFSYTLPANTLGANGVIKHTVGFGEIWIYPAGTTTITIRVYLGSTVMASFTLNIATGSVNPSALMEFAIQGNGATNAQLLLGKMIIGSSGLFNTMQDFWQLLTGSAAIDTTISQTVKVTAQYSTSQGNTTTCVGGFAFS
jgi:hypothetical protein